MTSVLATGLMGRAAALCPRLGLHESTDEGLDSVAAPRAKHQAALITTRPLLICLRVTRPRGFVCCHRRVATARDRPRLRRDGGWSVTMSGLTVQLAALAELR